VTINWDSRSRPAIRHNDMATVAKL
jgi:hypothetical protein